MSVDPGIELGLGLGLGFRLRLYLQLGVGLLLRLGIGLRLWLWSGDKFCNVNDPGIELDDGVCDFEKVLPDQLCPSTIRDLTGSQG